MPQDSHFLVSATGELSDGVLNYHHSLGDSAPWMDDLILSSTDTLHLARPQKDHIELTRKNLQHAVMNMQKTG